MLIIEYIFEILYKIRSILLEIIITFDENEQNEAIDREIQK